MEFFLSVCCCTHSGAAVRCSSPHLNACAWISLRYRVSSCAISPWQPYTNILSPSTHTHLIGEPLGVLHSKKLNPHDQIPDWRSLNMQNWLTCFTASVCWHQYAPLAVRCTYSVSYSTGRLAQVSQDECQNFMTSGHPLWCHRGPVTKQQPRFGKAWRSISLDVDSSKQKGLNNLYQEGKMALRLFLF